MRVQAAISSRFEELVKGPQSAAIPPRPRAPTTPSRVTVRDMMRIAQDRLAAPSFSAAALCASQP